MGVLTHRYVTGEGGETRGFPGGCGGTWRYSVYGKGHSDVILITPIGDGSINSQVCHRR